MVYKSIGYGGGDDSPRVHQTNPPLRQEGQLVALVGRASKGRPSANRGEEVIERVMKIDDGLLGYNIDGNRCLIRARKNDEQFDEYLSMSFTKGVTERETGRTLLILGSTAHHGEAMVGQFEGVLWGAEIAEDLKRYGDTIRWINVGDVKNGFIGLDYNPQAQKHNGVAISLEDVEFLAKSLIEFGYDPHKRLFLLKPPYIVESQEGKDMRKKGYERLRDYSKCSN